MPVELTLVAPIVKYVCSSNYCLRSFLSLLLSSKMSAHQERTHEAFQNNRHHMLGFAGVAASRCTSPGAKDFCYAAHERMPQGHRQWSKRRGAPTCHPRLLF